MLNRVLAVSSLLLLGAALPRIATFDSARAEDEAAVREALQHYLNGHATGSADEFRAAMYPQGTMNFIRDGKFTQIPLAEYIARAAAGSGKPAADEAKRKRRIELVDVAGNAALGKVVLEYPDATITDYMELLKIDGKWQIVAKTFYADRKTS
jgi:hypothetical protein